MEEKSNQTQKQTKLDTMLQQYHSPSILPHQAASAVIQTVDAPLPEVWSVVRRFDQPTAYKPFIEDCAMLTKETFRPGSMRMVMICSGLPADRSIDRLDLLDDESHIMVFTMVGGDHRLKNYQSTLTLHEEDDAAVVIESFVVDIPHNNTREETCRFAKLYINNNLEFLAKVVTAKYKAPKV